MAVKNIKKSNLFAALGAATGLSNAFRFPLFMASYGCSFFVAYVLSAVIICYPVLCFELGAVKSAKLPAFLIRAASANSFIIALYYALITSKLGGAALQSAFSFSVGGAGILPVSAVCAAAYVIIKRNALAYSGMASVASFFILFTLLAVKGAGRLGMTFGTLFCGGMWLDALSQALLSLSLAAGVMPALSKTLPPDCGVRASAAKIVAANIAGCALAAAGTVPYINCTPSGGLGFAFEVFPQIIKAAGLNARAAGFLIYLALFIVALHSTCSLACPLLSLCNKGPAYFCIPAILLAPLFSSCGGDTLSAADRMCCSVTAVIVAFAECVFFHLESGGLYGRIYSGVTCAVLALFCALSVCGARFSLYPPPARASAYAGLLFTAALSVGNPKVFYGRVKRLAQALIKRLKSRSSA